MKRTSVILTLLALLIVFPIFAQAAPIAKFTSIEGNVDMTPPGKDAVKANLGDPLNIGDIIRTKSKAKCEITFMDGSILRLAESSRLRVTEFSHEKEKRSATIDLFRGKVQNIVQAVAGQSKYEVHTPTAVCGVRGTQFYTYYQSGVSGAVVTEGTIYAYSSNKPGEVRTIGVGQAMVVTNANTPPAVRTATTKEMDQHQKDTKPAEKAKEEGKKDEEKKPEALASKTEEGKKEETTKEEAKKEEAKKEEQKPEAKAEEKPAETKAAEKPAEETSKTAGAATPTPAAEKPTEEAPKIVVAAASAAQKEQSAVVDIVSAVVAAAPTVPSTPQTTVTTTPVTTIPTTPIVPPQSDTTAPTITVTATPDKLTNASAATFRFKTDEKVAIKFRVDEGNWVEDTVYDTEFVVNLQTLSEKAHTFEVEAKDQAGNTSSTSYSWTTYYTAPTVTLSGTPAAITNSKTANIVVTVTDAYAVTTTYTLDGVAIPSTNLTGLSEGAHTLIVTATDAAGNTATKEYAWKTDYTAPDFTLTSQAAPALNGKADVKVVLEGGDNVTFSSLLDGTTSIAGASLDLKDLAPGAHTLEVKATDEVGNESSKSISFRLDRYALAGKFTGSVGNVSGTAAGEVAGVSGESWGGWKLEMKGSGDATPNATWTLSAGGKNSDGSYWLDVAPGTTDSAAKTLTGKSQMTYLSRDSIGLGSGSVAGQYDGLGAYSLTDVGAGSYTQKPLTFLSDLSAGRGAGYSATTDSHRGTYIYDDGRSYTYQYYDQGQFLGGLYFPDDAMIFLKTTQNKAAGLYYLGSKTYYFDPMMSQRSRTAYYIDPKDGSGVTLSMTESRDGNNNSEWLQTSALTSGTWDASKPLSDLITIPDAADYSSGPNEVTNAYGSVAKGFTGLLGGSDSLWSPTDLAPAGVTLMGSYDVPLSDPGQIWGTRIASKNYLKENGSTYDGGAFSGYLAGSDTVSSASPGLRSLSGMAEALYIDPNGNAGYLRGSLTGYGYPEIDMLLMSGNLGKKEMKTGIGILPENLSASLWSFDHENDNIYVAEYKTLFAGDFNGSGKITGSYGVLDTLSIVNYDTHEVQPWGIYKQTLAGTFENSAAATSWSGMDGGRGVFGPYKAYNGTLGSYSYSDGGYYYYRYNDINEGISEYYRKVGEVYSYVTIGYSANGKKTTCTDGACVSETWKPSETSLPSVLETPPDTGYASSWKNGPSHTGPGDGGYWLAKVTGSNGIDNTLGGTLSGRFITPTKMGDITGNLLGSYDTATGTWLARSLGEWSGTPLTFMSGVSLDGRKTTWARAGAYTYSGGGYYSYIYDIDNKYGNITYQQSGSIAYPRTSITFNGDGTTLTEIYNSTGKLTSSITGTWDPTTSLATLLVTPTPVAGQTTTVVTPEYTKSRLRGAGSRSGIMGGTESLWYGADGATINATKNDIPVTLIGPYNISGNYGANTGGNIWHTSTGSGPISSYNYIQGTSTTYEGGSYQGSMGGYELPSTASGERDLGGRLNALYIDPEGNAGYLEGILTGKAYPGTKMFEMDGALTRTQVETAAEMGVTAASDLTYNWGSLYNVKFNGISKDGTTTVGTINGYLNTGSSLTLFNTKSNLSVNWGRYGLVLYGAYDTAAANWEAKMGGQGSFGAYKRPGDTYISSSMGYWLADVDGAWTSDRFTSTLWGRFLSQTRMGEMDGTLGGTYDSTAKTWEATSGGKWSGAPLKFGNNFNSGRQNGLLPATSGSYNYSGGGNYWYNYNNDNSWGQQTFRPTSGSLPISLTFYNNDGTTRTEAYDASGVLSTSTGTWDKATSLSTLVTAPPPPATGETGTWEPQTAQYYYLNSFGSLNGNMGGTESLWYEADGATINLTKNDIPVTVMGQYSGAGPATGNLWYNSSFSEGNVPVYDGGRYQGIMGGIELPSSTGATRDLEGKIAALYIDPAGNAGYLRGDLSGKVYPGVAMFEMDGTLNRTQVATAADVGVSAADLTNNTYWGWINADYGVRGMFIDGATITGAITGKSYGSNTISIFNKTNTLFQGWGIYGLEFSGAYETAKPIWEAKTGGRGAFGVSRIITDSIVSDEGYWLADTNGSWADGKITGAVGGRFITNKKLGDIGGDLLGEYNTSDNTWQAVSLGTWSGTKLKFGNNFNSGRQNGLLPATNGSYNYSGGGSYWYNYNNDNSWGQQAFRPTSGSLPITFTYYNNDGTTRTDSYDASGVLSTSTGTWDKATSLSTLVTIPPTPCETETCTFQSGTYSYFNSIGSLNGNMGGTESLWYEADSTTINPTKGNIPVTVIGQYYDTGPATGNLWYTSSFSERGTPTYDGGRYQGIMGGIELPSSTGATRDLEGKIAALYIDPAGNAGYLRGDLSGKAYPGVTMFEMDGTLNRTQVATAADVGVSAAALTNNTHWGWINTDYGVSGTFSDGTTDTGAITANSYPANNTLSIFNKTSKLFQGWGIYGLGFSGAYNTDKPAWEARMGGRGAFGVGEITNDYIVADDGYWLADVSGSWAGGKLTGAVTGKFMTKRKMGEISGDLLGVYNTADSTWQAVSLGTWSGTPLGFGGESGYNSSFWQYQYSGLASDSLTTSGSLINQGWMQGLIGGTDTLFGTFDSSLGKYPAVTLAGLGSYGNSQGLPLFLTRFDGNDVKDATVANGYALLFGGVKSSTSMAGGMQGLYWKKNPTTGYEIGVLSGNDGVTANVYALSNNRMWELASGTTLQAYYFFGDRTSATDPVIENRTVGSPTTPLNVAAEVTSGTTSWQLWSRKKNIASFVSSPTSTPGTDVTQYQLSIGAEVTGGGYSGTPTSGDKFNLVLGGGNRYNATEITAVNGNVFDATTVAARIVMTDTVDSGYTTVEGGVLKGSFDPTAATWRAIALTTGMETKALLDKLNSFPSGSSGDAQRAAFYAATKIPAFTVGTTDLTASAAVTGSSGSIDMTSANGYGIHNATFLAPSTGGKPQIWASGNVNGAYTGNPAGTTVGLSGANGITANFNMQNWGTTNNKWGASVKPPTSSPNAPSGIGTYTTPFSFQGGAAGSIDSAAGKFSGTAAGIVK